MILAMVCVYRSVLLPTTSTLRPNTSAARLALGLRPNAWDFSFFRGVDSGNASLVLPMVRIQYGYRVAIGGRDDAPFECVGHEGE